MRRKEDFIHAGIDYRMEHGKPMAIGGGNFAEMTKEMNRCKDFETGAEYGFWYGAEETLHIVMQFYVKNNFTLPSNLEEIVKEKLEQL